MCTLARAVSIVVDVRLGDGCSIAALTSIEGMVSLGHHCNVGQQVVMSAEVWLGEHCAIGAGSIILSNRYQCRSVKLSRSRLGTEVIRTVNMFGLSIPNRIHSRVRV